MIAGAAIASSIKGAKAQTSAEDSAFKGAVRDAKNGVQDLPKIKRRFRRVMYLRKPLEQLQL